MLPPLAHTRLAPSIPGAVSLKLDEMWPFVRLKRNKRWIRLALYKHTRQIVARAIGGRGIATCQWLWNAISKAFKRHIRLTDLFKDYQAIIPDEQHQPVGEGSGLTTHIERFNNTLRLRLARLVRLSTRSGPPTGLTSSVG
jgi:insertion element IS1 protein InsB